MMQLRVNGWVKKWFEAWAEREGFVYQGRVSVARALTAVAEGKYEIVKKK